MGRHSKRVIAEKILKSILSSDWYKEYLSIISKCIDNSDIKEREKREQEIFDVIKIPIEFINGGCFKLAVKYKNFVIKFSLFENDSINNDKALLDYLEAEDLKHLKKYLCPMLAYSEHIAIYSLCKEYGYHTIRVANSNIEQYHEYVDSHDVDIILNKFLKARVLLDDVERSEQWGYFNRRLVLLDYSEWASLKWGKKHGDFSKSISDVISNNCMEVN